MAKSTSTAGSEAPPVVLVFLKAPRPGFVKTRLARDVGPVRTARIYRSLTEAQLRRIPPGWTVEIHYAPRGARAEMRAWLGDGWTWRVQRAGDLGVRLAAAFAHAFAAGSGAGTRRVLAIGADCPELDANRLRTAADALTRADVVLGPARDGGYYLIGLRRPAPDLFSAVPWSTADVLRVTRQRARVAGLRVRLLETLEDVDDRGSWLRARRKHPRSGDTPVAVSPFGGKSAADA